MIRTSSPRCRPAWAPPALIIDKVICTFLETFIDWNTQGWKVAPCHDLIGFRLTVGGAEDWN